MTDDLPSRFARDCRISPRTLERWRHAGEGPVTQPYTAAGSVADEATPGRTSGVRRGPAAARAADRMRTLAPEVTAPAVLTPTDVRQLIAEADAAAARLGRRLGLTTRADLDDLCQDLLLDLVRRLPSFDPARGSLGAFANIVLRNQSSRITMRHSRQRRAQGGDMLSLDAPLRAGSIPLCCLLTEADGLAAWHGQDRTALAECDDRHALQTALSQLAAEDRRLCAALSHRPVAALVAAGFGSRSALYRRLANLRHVLTAHGLGPAWDDLAAA